MFYFNNIPGDKSDKKLTDAGQRYVTYQKTAKINIL